MEKAFGLEIPQSLEEACNPRRMALIVYDMQVGILKQIKDGEKIISQVAEVLQAARLSRSTSVFLPSYVIAKRTDGRFSITQGYGVATSK